MLVLGGRVVRDFKVSQIPPKTSIPNFCTSKLTKKKYPTSWRLSTRHNLPPRPRTPLAQEKQGGLRAGFLKGNQPMVNI